MSESATISVEALPLANVAKAEAALAEIARKANRKGIPVAFTYEWSNARSLEVQTKTGYKSKAVIDLTIAGPTPRYAGWAFLATVEHSRDSVTKEVVNVFRKVPGAAIPVPEFYRNRGCLCDHCGTARFRANTYIVADEAGKTMQVGSACIKDFLPSGAFTAVIIAALWGELDEALAGCADEDEGGGFGGRYNDAERLLCDWLPFVAACIRTHGWTSKGTAFEKEGALSTAEAAEALAGWASPLYLKGWFDRHPTFSTVEVTDADRTTAFAAQLWARNELMTGEASSNEYLSNLHALARTNRVNRKAQGLAASMVSAYLRTIEVDATKAEQAAAPAYFGEVGKRATYMLVLLAVNSYDTAYGTTFVYRFRDGAGSVAIWKASSKQAMEIGSAYHVTGTVKEHATYRDKPQTVLTRCKVA